MTWRQSLTNSGKAFFLAIFPILLYHLDVEIPAQENPEESEKIDELARLRQTEKPTIPSVLSLSLLALLYVFINPSFTATRYPLLTILIVLNLLVFFFQIFVVPSRYYGQLLSNTEAAVLSLFAVAAVVLTGGFSSPLLFSLYMIMLSTPVGDLITPIVIATLQELFLGLAVLSTPQMMQQLFNDPIRGLLLFFSPLAIAYFTISMLYETFTQKKEKEKAKKLWRLLAQEKRKLEAVIGGIGELVVATDNEGKINLVNQSVQELTGIKEEKLLGMNLTKVFKGIKNETNSQGFEVRVRKAKEQLTFKVRLYRLFDAIGQPHGQVFVFHDITAEKELERMKIDFVSMAAHELRTPLTALKGYLSFLKGEVYPQLSKEQKVYLDRSGVSADTLSSLVDNLLNISRIESGNLELSLRKTDLPELFRPLIEQFKERARQKSIDLSFSFDPGISSVMIDGFRVNEVLANLLDNAINYGKSGGHIQVSVKQKGGEVETCVADDGPGIPEPSIKHLFTKFYRVSNVLGQGSKGTGLGLFICKSIVELHQGKIWVESKVGQGSKFCFSFPTAKT